MSEFGGLEEKAESLAQDHPDQAKKGMDEAAQFAERETGNKYDSQIEGAAGPPRSISASRTPGKAARTSSRGRTGGACRARPAIILSVPQATMRA